MSNNTITIVNQNQAVITTDVKKLFVFDNFYRVISFANTTGAEQVLVEGTVIGMIGATNVGEISKSAAIDGSQFPVGVLSQPATLAIAETRNLNICIQGHVAEDLLIFDGADDLDTDVDDKTYRDRLASDTVGIIARSADELTELDNL